MLKPTNHKMGRTRGFSLIELMFAMVIGIIILGGIFSLFITSRNTQRSSEDQLRLVADARFAINTFAYDLRHAYSYGATNQPETLYCMKNDNTRCPAALSPATDDCEVLWYIDVVNSLDSYDGMNPYGSTCATNAYKVGTDTLGVKYADSAPLSSIVIPTKLSVNGTYVRSNFQAAQIFKGLAWVDYNQYRLETIWETRGLTNNHRLVGHYYYVSSDTNPGDGMPSLRRSSLEPGPLFKDQVFIPGVVDMQIEFGVDITGNGAIDSFVKPNALPVYTSGPRVGLTNWSRAKAVKIWLLLRTERPDRDGILETRSFALAGNAASTIDTAYRHYMVSSMIKLRNIR